MLIFPDGFSHSTYDWLLTCLFYNFTKNTSKRLSHMQARILSCVHELKLPERRIYNTQHLISLHRYN